MYYYFLHLNHLQIFSIMAELTEIQNFYSGKTIFVTGGTGFAGKCLVEKLLRSCPVKSVILIIRSKRNKSVHERIEEYFKDVVKFIFQ